MPWHNFKSYILNSWREKMFINPVSDKELFGDRIKLACGNNPNANKLPEKCTYKEARNILKKGMKTKKTTNIFVGSNKGGVGKTMTALQISWNLHLRGYKVLLCDLDAQANITCSLLEDKNKIEADYSYFDVLTGDKNFNDIISEVDEDFCLMGANRDLSEIDSFLRESEGDSRDNEDLFADNDSTQDSDSSAIYKKSFDQFTELSKNFDFVIYDTNPETNRFNRISMQICDLALIPFQAKEASIKGHTITVEEINDSFLSIGRDASNLQNQVKRLFNNSSYIKDKKKMDDILSKIRGAFGSSMLNNFIDYSYELGEASDIGWPSFAHNGVDDLILSDIANIVDEIIDLSVSDNKEADSRYMFLGSDA